MIDIVSGNTAIACYSLYVDDPISRALGLSGDQSA